MKPFVRPVIFIIIIACIVGGIGYAIYAFVLEAHITISGSVASVTIYNGSNNAVVRYSKSTSFHLAAGSYDIEVTESSGAVVAKSYDLKLRDSQTLSLPSTAAAPITPQIATIAPAVEVTQEANDYAYLDTSQNSLALTNGDATTQAVVPPDTVNINTGLPASVIQISSLPNNQKLLVTSGNYIYLWNGSSLQLLSTQGIDTSAVNQQQVLVASNALDSDFIVSIGQTVYHYASASSAPTFVATLKKSFNRLEFGGGKFLAYSTLMPYSSTTDLAPYFSTQYLINPVLADLNGHSSQLSQPIVGASIAPDGQHILVTYRENSFASLYSIADSSLAQSLVAKLYRPTTVTTWTSNTTFAYEAGGNLWQYDTQSLIASALATDLIAPPSSITLQTDSSLMYTTTTSSGKTVVFKVAAGGPSTTAALNDFILKSLNGTPDYGVSYANITQPTFILSLHPQNLGAADGSNVATSIAQLSQTSVQAFSDGLTQAGVDPSTVSIRTAY